MLEQYYPQTSRLFASVTPAIFCRKLALLGLLTFSVVASQAQEAARMSLASEEAAEQRKKTSDLSYYNIQVGPVHARTQAELGVEATDNVNYAANDPKSDFSIRPGMNLRALWDITDLNRLYLSVGAGYIKHFNETDLDTPYVTPDSSLAFQMYVGDVVFDFHNRFSLTQDGQQIPTISRTAKLGRLQNTIGVGANWDLNKLIVSAGYDHDLLRSTESEFEYVNRDSELFYSRAAFLVNPTTRAGLEAGGGLTTYQQDRLNDNDQVSVGPFAEAQITDHIKGKLGGGYVGYFLSPQGAVQDRSTIDSFYANASVTHKVNQWLDHSVLATHQLRNGYNYVLLDLYRVEWRQNWALFRDTSFVTGFAFEHGKAYSASIERFDRWIVNAGVGHRFSPKFTGFLGYSFIGREADYWANDYTQNRLALDLRYSL